MKSDIKILSFAGELGDQIMVEAFAHRQNVRHSIIYAIKNSQHKEDLKEGTSTHVFTVPLRWAVNIRNSVSSMMTVVLNTYDAISNKFLGSSEVAVPVNVPIDIKPIIESIEINAINTGLAEGLEIYIQNISKLRVKTACRGVYSATIKNISIYVDGFLYKGNEITSQFLNNAGMVDISLVVTDSRGRQEKHSQIIKVIPYSPPSINSVKIERCNVEGIANETGSYINIKVDRNYTSIIGINKLNIKLYYKETNAETYDELGEYVETITYGQFNPEKSYDIKFVLKDGLGQTEYFAILATSKVTININEKGNGIGLGCMAKRENAVEISPKWNLFVKGKSLIDFVYPLGAIYISRNSISPQSLFGGTWKPIEGRFLLGANSNYPAGSTGGSFTHRLKINEMPKHRHHNLSYYEGSSTYGEHTGNFVSKVWKTARGLRDTSTYAGEGEPHNNTPPYYSLYMWERTA